MVIMTSIGAASPPPGDEQFGIIASDENANVNAAPAYMTSEQLMALLDDNGDGVIGDAGDDPNNDPVVVDITDATRYPVGHIPGSILSPKLSDPTTCCGAVDIAKVENLLKIRTELAKHCNKTIVIVCYTGTSDKWSRAVIGAMAQAGYFGTGSDMPAVTSLKWGNMGWNTSTSPPSYTNTYGLETSPNVFSGTNPYPVINNTTSTEPSEIVRAAGDVAIQQSNWVNINPGTGAGEINPTNIGNYTVIDVRSAAEYTVGHIPGAVNIPYQDMFKTDGSGDYATLLSIPRDKQILLYGDAEKEAAIDATALNMLGIRNASAYTGNIKFGLASWNNTVGDPFVGPATYPVATGSASGGFHDTYACSCTGSKPSLGLSAPSPYWASYADYTAGLLSVDWTVSNSGSNTAYDIAITGSTDTNGVTVATALPVTAANIMSPAGSASVTLKYNVPQGVGSWHTSIAGSATDICVNSYTYP